MPAPDEARTPVTSVLDRLLDHDPGVSREPPRSRHQVLRDLKEAVRRDLENLLNTRHSWLNWRPALKELNQSLLNYGLPDFTGAAMGSAGEREEFCRTLQSVLRRCEPRFQSVTVRQLDNAAPLDRTLRFRIDALLRLDPAPEPITFDSMLEPASATVAVNRVSYCTSPGYRCRSASRRAVSRCRSASAASARTYSAAGTSCSSSTR
jgi:type VI secretion system protein ImpF